MEPPTECDDSQESESGKADQIVSVTVAGRTFRVVGQPSSADMEGMRRFDPSALLPENRVEALHHVAAIYDAAWRESPDDEEAKNGAWILRALTDPKFDVGPIVGSLMKHHYKGLGPRSRSEEADAVCALIGRGLEGRLTMRQLAEKAVDALRVAYPQIRKDTCVPPIGMAWPEERQEHVITAVELAFEKAITNTNKHEPETLARVLVRALGGSPKNMFAHLDQRRRNKKRRED